MSRKPDKMGKFIKGSIGRNLWLVLVTLSLVILTMSFLTRLGPDVTSLTARRLERKLDKRMTFLDGKMEEALEAGTGAWPSIDGLPEDMVIYRYVNDTLKSWHHQFSLDNDDLNTRILVPQVSNLRYNRQSPLIDADTVVSFMNIGPRWYLVKMMQDVRGCKVIGGIQIINRNYGSSYNGVNPRLKISDRFALHPISASGGATVTVQGRPLMKLIQENSHVMALWPDIWAVWLSLVLLLAGVLLRLSTRRTLRRMRGAIFMNTLISAIYFLLGYAMRSQSAVFSPTVYADGGLLYSLGAVLIVNMLLTMNVICIYMCRYSWLRYLRSGNVRSRRILYVLGMVLCLLCIMAYAHVTFCSLIINSNINLELYQVGDISLHTILVYLSYLGLLLTIPLLLQMLSPVIRDWTGLRYDVFSRTGRLVVSVLGAAYLLVTSSSLSLKREEGRAEIWANRLSINRDLAFEIQLRNLETSLANDGLIPSLLAIDPDFGVIINRVKEDYIDRLAQSYDVGVYMFRDRDADAELYRFFNERMFNGTPLAPGSRFVYTRSAVGRGQYTGLFTYYNSRVGVVHLLVAMESKAESEGRGYDVVMSGGSRTVPVSLPQNYSYAKYLDGKLVGYRGDFAYPTVLSGRLKSVSDSASVNYATIEQYVHFVTPVSADEYVVISRRANDVTRYFVAGFMLLLVSFMGSGVVTLGRRRKAMFEYNYYKRRLNILLMASLSATLVSLALISVLFIYRRNDENMHQLMASKIGTIQSLVEAQSRQFRSVSDLSSPEFDAQLRAIGNYTGSDISVYSTEGRIITSTYPDIFASLAIGTRLNGDAYRSIIYDSKRYVINRESVAGHVFYTMSAPVFDSRGNMQAIVNSPYTDTGLAFRNDALFHASFVIVVFLILLVLSRWVSGKVVDKMFRPLVDMGKKMQQAKNHGLEYIIYDRDDEIATLVDSYNRMVHDLSESSKQSATVERNRAWTEMARQIAHEIKNPLTPIKLQIQRIVRFKSKNDPLWPDKFDAIVPVILDSIDRLTETANEFSNFAKLYGEEAVEIDLDALATDQVALQDSRDGITFQYIGLKDAVVMGPKPQLTRVFVNLLTNSIQAIEGMRHEQEEAGQPVTPGKVFLSVRNSSRDGYYDIVFEDNGPGVKDENRVKLFTPNFTTKSSGTGLGLAICKSILDLCGAEISYSTSFALGGACFTIRYPKKP